MQKTMFLIKYLFRPVFCRFGQKMAAIRPPIFPANLFLFSAGFELFCRIFSRLATVKKKQLTPINPAYSMKYTTDDFCCSSS
jgi:hypothetical protein